MSEETKLTELVRLPAQQTDDIYLVELEDGTTVERRRDELDTVITPQKRGMA